MKKLLIFILLMASWPTLACSCEVFDTEHKFKNSDYVYYGQIVSSELKNDEEVFNKLKVIEAFKGEPETEMLSYVVNGMCSMPSATGMTYIVYGNNAKQNKLSLCSFTQPFIESTSSDFDKKLALLRALANK